MRSAVSQFVAIRNAIKSSYKFWNHSELNKIFRFNFREKQAFLGGIDDLLLVLSKPMVPPS